MTATAPAGTVRIAVLGGFSVVVDGRRIEVDDFPRRDAAQLVKLLALVRGHRLHQEQLIDRLWPDAATGTVANRLHKAAHYARRTMGRGDAITLVRSMVALLPNTEVRVDAIDFDRLAGIAVGAPTVEAARESAAGAVERYGGPLLPDDPYESWALRERERLALRYREMLQLLHRYDEMVTLDPTDETAHVALMRRSLRAGDWRSVLTRFDLLATTLRTELGVGPSREAVAVRRQALADRPAAVAVRPAADLAAEPAVAPRHADLATQRVGFCTTADGVRLAYATSGAGPPLVKVANWLTHLDYDWASPVWRPWWQALSDGRTLVRYDERGCGLSDREVDSASFGLDPWVADLGSVVDTLGLERFPLLGMSQGGPIAVSYAAAHPERVSRLIIYGTCARSTWDRASPERKRELRALGELIRVSWGRDEPGFMQVYDARFLPDGPIEAWRAFDELQRRSTSARNAARLWAAFGHLDAADAARSVTVPTLILHTEGDQVWPFAEAEELHELIPHSRLVRLPGRNHILQAGEPAFDQFMTQVRAFLGEDRDGPSLRPPGPAARRTAITPTAHPGRSARGARER